MRTTGGGVGRQVARWTGRRVPRADPTVWQVAYLVVIVLAVVGSVAWQWFAKVAAPALGAHAGGPGLGCAFLLAGVLVVQGGLTLVLRVQWVRSRSVGPC